jgi:hypothetical protein
MTNHIFETWNNDRYEDGGRNNTRNDIINNVIFAESTRPINSDSSLKESWVLLDDSFVQNVLIDKDVINYSGFEAYYF